MTTDTVERRVQQYRAIEVEIEKIETRHKEELKQWLEMKNALKGWFTNFFEQAGKGATSIKTKSGTIVQTTRYSSTLQDSEAFMRYVIENQAYDLIERRANSTAVREFVKSTGELPPGCSLNAMRSVSVRAPS